MLNALASLFFYARFLPSFSRLGYVRRARGFEALDFDFRGQRWVVSGATGGIGRAIALGAAAAGADVVALGRDGARLQALEAADADSHNGLAAYAQHKRAQVELTRWWNALGEAAPRAYAMHPGWVDTDGVRSALPQFRRMLGRWLRSAEEGADTALWLAAKRPPLASKGGLWLDRQRETEHAFGFTRGGASAEALVAHLRARLQGMAPWAS